MWRVCGVTANVGIGGAEYIYPAAINTLTIISDFLENIQSIHERWKLQFAKVWNRVLELYDWKCVIGGLGRGWNPMQGLSLCARLNDRVYINMKSVQLPLMELSGVIVYPVMSGLRVHPLLHYSAISFSLCSCISLFVFSSRIYICQTTNLTL